MDELGTEMCPLFQAIVSGDKDDVKCELEKGHDVNKRYDDDFTPLMKAVKEKNLIMAKLLIECGAEVNADVQDELSPLMLAIRTKYLNMVHLLVAQGADLNLQLENHLYMTPLAQAVRHNDAKIVKLLLDCGAKIKDPPDELNNELATAVMHENKEIAKMLIDNGADFMGEEGAFSHAVEEGSADMVEFLIKSGADPNMLWSKSLSQAAQNGHISALNVLFQNGLTVQTNNMSEENYTGKRLAVVYAATTGGKVDAIKLLVEHGADIDEKHNTGDTPLCCAASRNDTKTVCALLSLGADPNLKAKECISPLQTSIMGTTDSLENNIDTIKQLIKYGADVNGMTSVGISPLYLATKIGKTEIAKLLIENKAVSKDKDEAGRTILHVAAKYGMSDVVRMLMERGLKDNKKDNEGNTAEMLAEVSHNTSTRLVFQDMKKRKSSCCVL